MKITYSRLLFTPACTDWLLGGGFAGATGGAGSKPVRELRAPAGFGIQLHCQHSAGAAWGAVTTQQPEVNQGWEDEGPGWVPGQSINQRSFVCYKMISPITPLGVHFLHTNLLPSPRPALRTTCLVERRRRPNFPLEIVFKHETLLHPRYL